MCTIIPSPCLPILSLLKLLSSSPVCFDFLCSRSLVLPAKNFHEQFMNSLWTIHERVHEQKTASLMSNHASAQCIIVSYVSAAETRNPCICTHLNLFSMCGCLNGTNGFLRKRYLIICARTYPRDCKNTTSVCWKRFMNKWCLIVCARTCLPDWKKHSQRRNVGWKRFMNGCSFLLQIHERPVCFFLNSWTVHARLFVATILRSRQ